VATVSDLPPGPRGGVLRQTVAFHRDPLAFLRAGQVEFGDVFTIRLLTARPIVVAAAPESVDDLLRADPETAHAGEARRSVLPFASPDSVFGGDSGAHRAALTWLLDRLGRERELAEAFLAEPEGEIADSVVKETLRLQPSASAALRRLTAPRRVGGHDLPAGVDVMIPSTLLHRDPRGFREPDAFRPERWRGSSPPNAPFFPFGGGARRCIGEHLAHAEIATVVPAFLRVARPIPLSAEPERMVQRAKRRDDLIGAAEDEELDGTTRELNQLGRSYRVRARGSLPPGGSYGALGEDHRRRPD
jgi:cytochrome P450